jgi:hypothetical protein
MTPPGYSGYRFPSDVIQHAFWMYLRFTLSYRDVEDLLAERGIEVSYETIRRWVSAFGAMIARRLRAQRPAPHRRWHLDEMFIRIGGKQGDESDSEPTWQRSYKQAPPNAALQPPFRSDRLPSVLRVVARHRAVFLFCPAKGALAVKP